MSDKIPLIDVSYSGEIDLHDILDSISLISLTLDRAGTVTFCNRHFFKITGLKPDKVLGKNWFKHFFPHKTGVSLYKTYCDALKKNGHLPECYDNEIEDCSGERRLISWQNAFFHDADGEIIGCTIIGVDVTDTRLARIESETISRISQLFLSSENLGEVYEKLPVILEEQFNYPFTGIIEYDRASDEIIFVGSTNIPRKGSGRPRFPADMTMAGTVIKTGEAIAELDVTGRSDYINPILRELRVKTFICEPIFIRGTVFGCIIIADSRVRNEVTRIARTIRIIADYLSREISRKQTEQSLRESEDLNRNLISSINEGVIIFDLDFRIILWNRFMEELTGYQAGEVAGDTMPEHLRREGNMGTLDDLRRALEGETFSSGDLEVEFSRSGRKGWVICQYTPLRNSGGEIIGVITSIRDITECKIFELSLGKTQEDLRETLEATTVGIWTWNIRNNELYFSPRWYTMLGYEPGEFPSSYKMWAELIHPDDLPQALSVIDEYIKSKPDYYESEYRLRTKRGEYRWINSKARVVDRDETGAAVRLIGNHEDITDRKDAEERLRWQLALNMSLAGLSGSIISNAFSIADIAAIVLEYAKMLSDSKRGFVSEIEQDTGDIIIHAKTKILGDQERISQKINTVLQPGDSRKEYAGLISRAIESKLPFFSNIPPTDESRSSRSGESGPPIRFLVFPVINNDVVVGQIVLADALRDYTEGDLVVVRRLASLYAIAINRIRSDEQLKDSLHEKEVLIKELHHRVKNNLQVVSSLLALQSRKVDNERYQGYFKESQNRIHAMALVHEKLYHSEALSKIDFSRYIFELVQHLFYSYNINRDMVTLRLDIKDLFLSIDTAVPCAMIINELVSNSLKHAFPGRRKGVISISLNRNGEEKHTLSVHDDGVGMPGDFDLQKTDSLGMQIVTSLTRQIRGTLTVERSGGTTVSMIF
ncbi:MAG: hypothetical protein A2176_10130 [Spirochaetes bacterium RBG_13_51_14]|nr:MAG: hypothetical protein A2176_10130 [Spirochaetes bacterium RBG_13_51_14]